jgi:hypothetical protein
MMITPNDESTTGSPFVREESPTLKGKLILERLNIQTPQAAGSTKIKSFVNILKKSDSSETESAPLKYAAVIKSSSMDKSNTHPTASEAYLASCLRESMILPPSVIKIFFVCVTLE